MTLYKLHLDLPRIINKHSLLKVTEMTVIYVTIAAIQRGKKTDG